MIRVPIDAVPNQTFSIVLEEDRYDFELKSSQTSTFATITKNEVVLISSVRCVGGTFLIPYSYLVGTGGNFIFETPNEVIPYYPNFGVTQFLTYMTAAEIANA